MRNTRSFITVLAAFACCFELPAQLSHPEELTIRQAYARLAMATEIKIVEDSRGLSPAQFAKKMEAGALSFEVVSIESGDISKVMNDTLGELGMWVQSPEYIQITTASLNSADNGVIYQENAGATAQWSEREPNKEGANMKYGDLLAIREALPYDPKVVTTPRPSRYAHAFVAVHLAGKSRTYRALFLMDARGKVLEVDDPVINDLESRGLRPIYPNALLNDSAFNSDSNARHWFATHLVPECAAGKKSDCCETKCGISPADVPSLPSPAIAPATAPATGPTASVPTATGCGTGNFVYPPTFDVKADNGQHWTGQHDMDTANFSSCVYTNPPFGPVCVTAAVASETPVMNESGIKKFGFHVDTIATTSASAVGFGAIQTPAAKSAGAVNGCLLSTCTTTISISGPGGSVSFPPGLVCTHTNTHTTSCPAFDGIPQSGGEAISGTRLFQKSAHQMKQTPFAVQTQKTAIAAGQRRNAVEREQRQGVKRSGQTVPPSVRSDPCDQQAAETGEFRVS